MTRRTLTVQAPDEFSSAAQWADAYRALGLAVIPARGQEKIPLGKWQEFQNGIPQAVHDRWYGDNGDNRANYRMGLLTGAASIGDGWKLLLIDLDEKGAVSGSATWDQWIGENELGCDPETWRARTGGGGQHIYFKYPAHLHIRNTQETIAGIDVRAEGGFVITPPSRHVSGRQYTWLYSPFETDLAEAPDWLLEKVGASAAPLQSATTIREKASSPEQSTDAWGHIIDGRDAYMRDMIWAAVVDWHRECPIPPTEHEIERKLLEAYAVYERKVRPQDPSRTLEDEERGITAFRAKWVYAMRQWDGKVAEAAKVPGAIKAPAYDFSPAAPTAERFKFETVSDLRKLPPIKWLVDGWIPEGSTGLFYGKWAAGKSFIAFDLALHLAYGMEAWHGVKLPKGGVDVLVIAREGHQGFVQRIDAFKQHYGIVDDAERIQFMRASVSFMLVDDFNALCAAIKGQERPYRLVLLDTVARVLPGVDMNAQETVTAFMERCSVISQITGAATIGVHHQNKSGGMMGSTFFEANSDFVFEVERLGDEDEPLRQGEITCTKMKDGEDRWKRTIRYEKVATGPTDGSLVVSSIDTSLPHQADAKLPPMETCRRILAAIDEAWKGGRALSHFPHAQRAGKYAQRVLGVAFGLPPHTIEHLIIGWLDNDILAFETADKKSKTKGLKVVGSL